ncbi:hypothetical protein CMMCAS03_08255 [Clavibacter michiganensis subsp. michiganensis]|nr:hypothetical protein CMMCAS03_08255 [Clavibacter michiganensis subsp. michiganensis]
MRGGRVRMRGAVGVDEVALVGREAAAAGAGCALGHVGGEQAEAVRSRPGRGAERRRAVAEPVGEAGGRRLHRGGEGVVVVLVVGSVGPLVRARHPSAAQQVAEAQEPLAPRLLVLGRRRVHGPVDRGHALRAADREAGAQAAAGEEVDGREVLREAERVLGADRDGGGAERDAARALRGGGEHRDGGGDRVAEVVGPEPRGVEAERVAELNQPERLLEADGGIGRMERAGGEEAEARRRGSGCGHATRVGGADASAPTRPQGMSTIDPVVRLASRSSWARAASASG